MLLYYVKNISEKLMRMMENKAKDIYDPEYKVNFPKEQWVMVDKDFYNYLHRWPQFFGFKEEVIESSLKKLETVTERVDELEKRIVKLELIIKQTKPAKE